MAGEIAGNTHDGQPVINTLIGWASKRASVRAMLLTSSRANPTTHLDAFSDYDIILAVEDIHEFLTSDDWLDDLGKVLVVYRDPVRADRGLERFARITQYKDGTKIDFTVWPVELLKEIAAEPVLPDYLDDGYTILLDKSGLTRGLKPPSFSSYVPARPAETVYLECVEEFFSESCYVAKQVCRSDLFPLKYNLDYVMKHQKLRQMLEWQAEVEHDWSLKTGSYGKRLKEHVRPELWAELESTYVGAGAEENWEALFKTIALFRTVAMQVGNNLGYKYPRELDDNVVEYLREVQRLHT